jgi:hypothetical protein
MAPRLRAVGALMSDDLDRSGLNSSPDPLAASINENKTRGGRITTRSKQPLTSTSPSKQNRTSTYAELDRSSPSKSVVLSTPGNGGASPWRIKVTVEAEPGTEDENADSPIVKRITRTKTSTVPLKDADATSPAKRRGRPRKSDVANTKSKRNGTPVRRAARPKARASSVGAEGSSADMDTDAPPKKRRGRPRKSIQPPTEDEDMIVVAQPPTENEDTMVIAQPSVEDDDVIVVAQPLVRNETVLADASMEEAHMYEGVGIEQDTATPRPPPIARPIIEATFATPQEHQQRPARGKFSDKTNLIPPAQKHKETPDALREYEEPMRFTPPQTELSSRIRARKSTPAHKETRVPDAFSDEESGEDSEVHTPSETDEEAAEAQEQATSESEDSVAFEAPEDDIYDAEDGVADATDFAFEDGATRMPDDTTILESENFSMVSVDSLPSNGGFTSPALEKSPAGPSMESVRNSEYLKIAPVENRQTQSSLRAIRSSSGTTQIDAQMTSSRPAALLRHKTPSVQARSPSNPPPIAHTRLSPTEAETPKIRQVVKAGVALQGLLDPNHRTPEAGTSQLVDEDIFRGFSERTRKELQAGLRLGEQLAQQGPPSTRNSPALSSPNKVTMESHLNDDVFAPTMQRSTRLLTPEEADVPMMPSPPPTQPTDVQYPNLNVVGAGSQLISPARSEDEMSWRVDTPPVRGITVDGQRFMTASNEAGQIIRGREISVVADEDEQRSAANEHGQVIRGREISVVADEDGQQQKEYYGDIWEEEASRSSNSLVSAEGSPQVQDLFAQEGLVKPARGKLPRTWRRKSSGNFHYSDEAEEIQEQGDPLTASDGSAIKKVENGKAKVIEPMVDEDVYEDENMSEESDDTGMFFTNNMPHMFNNRRSTELRNKNTGKLDLSLLINEGESLVPESSPPVAKTQTPVTSKGKLNPFLDTPPRFAAFQSSPIKSSPLRHEIRTSDTSLESVQQGFEESTLPLAPSSPFHTQVEGESVVTMASDQRQFREEIAGTTDSSLRNIRDEADDYLDAYSAQERTLGEIEEVTEPSRTWNKETSAPLPTSPIKEVFEESMLKPARTYPSLFSGEPAAESSSSTIYSSEPSKSVDTRTPPTDESSLPPPHLFGRLTSTLWSALGSTPPPPPHPILSKYDRLPRHEPWTKTHYKTLDALYQRHKKQPTLFLPSPSANRKNTNNGILETFLRTHKRPFVGARYAVWGYSVTLDESLVVLCAVYMQLLVLRDIWEYEKSARKEIQMGDCGPGVSGVEIAAEEVVKRLATVVMGEELRRDEKRGVRIERKGELSITWPA